MAKVYGFTQDMFILKSYIYEKEGRYLTLVSMVPKQTYNPEIKTHTDKDGHTHPLSHGVFVRVIGSMTGLVPTNSPVPLKTYQDMIINQGWTFKTTVAGVRGTEWDTAQKLSWAEIQRLKKTGGVAFISGWKEYFNSLSNKKQDMLRMVDTVASLSDKGGNVTTQLKRLTEVINSL